MALDEDLKLARQLVDAGKLTQAQVEQCLKIVDQREQYGFRKSLADVAVELSMVTQDELAALQAPPQAPPSVEGQAEPAPDPTQDSPPSEAAQAPSSQPMGTEPPIELDGFKRIKKIGQGALGDVYEAEQVSLQKRVALKILKSNLAEKKSLVDNFLKEAKSAANLTHKNIVQAIAAGESFGFYYFAMEFVEGWNLKDYVAAKGPLPEKKALTVAAKIAEGLSAASSQGFVHRDIKPANIMITPDGVVKIADFGLALPPNEKATAGGTPAYMAPEQFTGEGSIDIRADIFGLGATLYYLLTGKPPYSGVNAKQVLAKRLAGETPPRVKTHRPEITLRTTQFIEKLMNPDLSGRAQNLQTVIADIARLLQSGPKTQPQQAASRPGPSGGRQRRAMAAAGSGRTGRRSSQKSRGGGGSRRAAQAHRYDDIDDEDLDEPVQDNTPKSYRFTLIGLVAGLIIAVLLVVLTQKKESTITTKQKKPQTIDLSVQKFNEKEFQENCDLENKRAEENLARFRNRPDMTGTKREKKFRQLLYEHALSAHLKTIAEEWRQAWTAASSAEE